VRTAGQLLTLDPLQEPLHRTLMRLQAQLGQGGAALPNTSTV
jgi:DNA-binding SARP family transcriptional activator